MGSQILFHKRSKSKPSFMNTDFLPFARQRQWEGRGMSFKFHVSNFQTRLGKQGNTEIKIQFLVLRCAHVISL